ncbi:MAG: helix-turn-helix domain-containing protein [Bacilli bacterium]|nr:helix-turn-helix domain-containing protein [Bacilli bacterium]
MVGQRGYRKQVLNWLQTGNTITNRQAYEKFGIIRLSAIIYDLRGAGYDIRTVIMDNENREAKYYLII